MRIRSRFPAAPAFPALLMAAAIACDSPTQPKVVPPPTDTVPKTVPRTLPVFVNGAAQVVPGFADAATWIRQEVWVETSFDSDGDGRLDRMHADVTRPGQTQTEGLKVPVVYESSPYYAGTAATDVYWDVRHELGATPPPRPIGTPIVFRPVRPSLSSSEVATWLPRGFAVVHSDAPGTGLSHGCVAIGGEYEALAPKAIIDWLNGRARAYTSSTGTDTVGASWSTGRVGMIGTSYNGTLAIAAATTGVTGLEAIIPVSPLTSYYGYYRANGLVRSPGGYLGEDADVLYDVVNSGDPARRPGCDHAVRDAVITPGQDRVTGDFNAFWSDREMVAKTASIRAATLLAHGLNDWNVMPSHSINVFDALKQSATPSRLYLHQGGHGGEPPLDMQVRWFTRFLYNVQNGVESEPRAYIAQPGQSRDAPVAYPTFPIPGSVPVALQLRAGGGSTGGLVIGGVGDNGVETLVDNPAFTASALAAMPVSGNRLLYASDVLTSPLMISGWPKVQLRVASNRAAANISVYLIVLPPASAPPGPFTIVTRGWADPQNSAALTGSMRFTSMEPGRPLAPGVFENMTFYLEPDDQLIPAGMRLGLMIIATDREFTIQPSAGTEVSVDLSGTTLTLPVVGGRTGW